MIVYNNIISLIVIILLVLYLVLIDNLFIFHQKFTLFLITFFPYALILSQIFLKKSSDISNYLYSYNFRYPYIEINNIINNVFRADFSSTEIGFVIYAQLLRLMNFPDFIFIIIPPLFYSLVLLDLFFFVVNKEKKYFIKISLLLYMTFNVFTIRSFFLLRQTLSVGFFYLSLKKYFKKDFFLMIMLGLISISMHKTALLGYLIYTASTVINFIISQNKLRKNSYTIAFLLFFTFLYIYIFRNKYLIYYDYFTNTGLSMSLLSILVKSMPHILIYIFSIRMKLKSNIVPRYLLLVPIGIMLLTSMNYWSFRVIWYLLPIQFIYFKMLTMKSKSRSYIILFITILENSFYIYTFLMI